MKLTKPAGCALQVFGAMFLIPACLMFVPTQNASGARESSPILGIFFLAIGAALLWVGRKPAVDK